MNEAPQYRILVKDGKWQVPESERPSNWRSILPETSEPEPLDPSPAPPPTQQPDSAEPPAAVVGRRHALYPLWEHDGWIELRKAIELSGAEFCGHNRKDKRIIEAALVLCAGMFTRTGPILRRMTGVSNEKPFVQRCYDLGVWKTDDRGVTLGKFGEDLPSQQSGWADLEFWMIAMAVAGEIHRNPDGTFQSLESLAEGGGK